MYKKELKEGGGSPPAPWHRKFFGSRSRTSLGPGLTLPSLSSRVELAMQYFSISVGIKCFSILHSGQYYSQDSAELFNAVHCSKTYFTVLHSGLTMYCAVFQCISMYFCISVFPNSLVEFIVAQWADSSLTAAASKFLATIRDSGQPTRCRGNYLQTPQSQKPA